MVMMEKKRLWLWSILIVFLFLGFCSPVIGWLLKPSTPLDVLIVDKTVPDESYREHLGLTWLLNQQKIQKTDGSNYKLHSDYVGYDPVSDVDNKIRAYPENKVHDVIYIADGYGVYEEDITTGNAQGQRSELIYGGITSEDVDYIREAVFSHGTTLIGEFNTFGSPTPQEVKESFYQLYNLEWTGWIGRFFTELEGAEVPVWAKKNYLEQYGKEWDFSGKGMVFVHDSDQLLVLTEEDMEKQHVMFEFTQNGKEHFNLQDRAAYHYWFNIIVPKEDDEVLASFSLSLTNEAEERLIENGIPVKFPAVIHHVNPTHESYYFSGDFADQADLPSLYQAKGYSALKKWQSRNKDDLKSFYWRVYHPMMSEIMQQQKNKSTVKKEVNVNLVGESYIPGRVGKDYLQIQKDGKWEDFLIKGVNMGIAKPGTWPGETAITKQEYYRWFEQIGDMNANAIRIYTIHPPHFYEALAEYNRRAEEPIYLFHGIWINEEVFLESNDAFAEENVKDFKEEIQKTVDLIHGNAVLEERPGHAHGNYTADVSPYVLGWVLGVEWDPQVVLNTNRKHSGMSEYNGEFLFTKGAQPFEVWLAEMMEYTIAYEQEIYQWQRPMSFTNWVTTDLLTHPSEPSEQEDLVSVNPNLIFSKDEFEAGMFASYHIYPYYPDFLNFEERYVDYIDHREEKNNYAGYLQHMKEAHSMPLLVAEFGIPSSRGNTHNNIYGWNQGGHTEKEQGEILAHLFEDIVEENMAGGLIFSWHDEWFKRTWNTMDFDNPDQRPYWKNVQTNEQMFGMLTFEPGQAQKIVIDGKEEDWKVLDQETEYSSSSIIKEMQITHDEGFLYVKLKADKFKEHEISLLFNIMNNQGQSKVVPGSDYITEGIDFILQVENEKKARMLVDSYYDSFYYMYGHKLAMVEKQEYADKKDNGIFHPIRLTLNKELTYKNENDEKIIVPFDSYETGIFRSGNSNPNAENFDSLTDFYLNEEKGLLEVRIPWAMLNVKDPSQREVMGDMWTGNGLNSSAWVDGIRIGAIAVSNSDGKVVDSFPKTVNGKSRQEDYYLYAWDQWEMPIYHERLKQSYYRIQQLFFEVEE